MAGGTTLEYTRSTTFYFEHEYIKDGLDSTSGMTLLFTVKKPKYDTSATDTTAIISKTIPMNGSPLTLIQISPDDVADNVPPGTYNYSIHIKETNGPPPIIYPGVSGTFILVGDSGQQDT